MALIPLTNITKAELTGKQEKGLVNKILIALREDIETMPSRDGVTLAGVATITGDIVFKSTKQFFELDFTRETGELKFALEGENDSKISVSTLDISVPTMTDIILGFIEEYKNADVVILAQETCGDWRLMGDHCQPTQMITAEGTTGKARGDYKGTVITFDSIGISPIYKGLRQLTPAA